MWTDAKVVVLIVAATAVSRIVFAESDFGGFSYDSGSYALAAQSYDISETRPHLPGYYLHIQTIKLVAVLTGGTHSAMMALSVLYSSLGLGLLYLLLRRWFDNSMAILLTALTFSNPMVWFYGCVTEIYAFDLFFSVALALLCSRSQTIYLTPFFMGFLSGVRPSSALLMLPLYVFFWYRHVRSDSWSVKPAALSHLLGIGGVLLWFIPMVASTGGMMQYFSLYATHYPVEKISLLQNGFRFSSFLVFLVPPLLIMVAYRFTNRFFKTEDRPSKWPSTKGRLPEDFIRMMGWWLAPSAIFFTFIHYSKGYFLICAAAFFSLMIAFVYNKPRAKGLICLAILSQALIFIFVPYATPDLQTYVSPQMRSLNLAQVWWNRTNSVYLMAQSHIRALERVAELIESALDSPEALGSADRDLVFLDPTFPLSIRSMQVRYPDLKFMRLSYREMDRYETYSGLRESSGANLAEAIAGAVIVSRADFVRRFLSEIPKQIYHSGDFVVFSVTPEGSQSLTNSYTSYFLRT